MKAFPNPLVLLFLCIALAAVLTHVLPAGEFERRDDPDPGRRVVVAGTDHPVERAPVGAFQAVVAIPRGMADAGGIIFFIFLIGGAFTVVERTGTLARMVQRVVQVLGRRDVLAVPIVSVIFGLGGILIQMQEELIAFVPLLLLLVRQLRFDRLTAVAMSLGAAAVGAAFSPVNPFQVIIAQKVSELPPQSGFGFRVAFLVPAMGIWIWGTVRHAKRVREATAGSEPPDLPDPGPTSAALTARDYAILATVLGAFVLFVFGAQRFGWDFEHFAAVFLLMGIIAGLVGGLGAAGTAEGFTEGFRSIAFASLLVGVARAIYLVLQDGRVIDTIVHGVFAPIAGMPAALAGIGMMVIQAAVHVPVPSTSGQAVLTLPVLAPVSDLLGMSRQVAVLAYHYGAGLCDLLTPTNGALMAMLAASGVPYDQWLRFAVRWLLAVALLGAVAILTAAAINLP